ncbi:MAG TPA: YceI family protein [Thermoanaerobaculia bacterium]|nr:YceI family protein [Thermoanaerobaculia bacterium]
MQSDFFSPLRRRSRQDFGVSFNGPFEKIGQIGDEVWIEIAIEAVQIP